MTTAREDNDMTKHARPAHLLLGVAALALLLGSPADAWYPNTTQVELLTATWCGNCPNAYAGIDSCMDWYNRQEFNAIRYYDDSGGLGSVDGQERIDYYPSFGFPRAFFGGMHLVFGSPDFIATGIPYNQVVLDQLDDPAHFKITINSWDLEGPDGSIDLDIEVTEDVPDASNMWLRMALTEDDVAYGPESFDDVTRDMLEEVAITVDQMGEIQNVNQNFAIDAGWSGPLEIVAFIQDDADRRVHASAVTQPTPDYAFRYYALGDRILVGPAPSGTQAFDFFHTVNTGNLADTYTISVDLDAPNDWTAVLCEEGICWGPVVERPLDPGEDYALKVELEAPSSGYGVATVTITQDNLPSGYERTLQYVYISDDLDVLLVDDDWIAGYEDAFTDALDYFGYSYGVWDHNLQVPSAAVLGNFPIAIWATGSADPDWNPVLTQEDRDALAGYLDGGGNLFITGADIASALEEEGGAGYQWLQDYLHATMVAEVMTDRDLEGVPGDPVSTELDLVIEGGDGADNQNDPDDIDPADGSATVIWTYDDNRNGALRADTGTYKVVFQAFGFEAIDNASDRRITLRRIIRWFQGVGEADETPPVFRAALNSLPNPVRNGATLRFTLPQAGPAELHVFGLDGRLVRTLASGMHAAGNHVVSWDRTDQSGARVPAGVYYYALDAEGVGLSHKVVLLK
ncbi:MAG: hypothetical protein GF330_03835 [Candidatus Eisenbacteria bacterium]|nr:hypothetical protein [Candidatus Eisenbacteria bacterium]